MLPFGWIQTRLAGFSLATLYFVFFVSCVLIGINWTCWTKGVGVTVDGDIGGETYGGEIGGVSNVN